MSDPQTSQPFLGIHAVNVFVRDQDQSLDFFVRQLGFRLAFDARLQTGDRWVAVAPRDGSAVLALVAPKPDSKAYRMIGRPTGIVFVSEDVVAKYEEWRSRGVNFRFAPRLRRVQYSSSTAPPESQLPAWGGVFTEFRDIDGNLFSLVGFDEVNREIEEERRRIHEKLEAERRATQELEIAKQVQARLFPQRPPSIDSLEYAGICIQARQVGGDYHDFLDLGRGRFALVLADISGKGIAAALLMANLQANVRSQCAIAVEDPERLLRSVNQLFYENTDESAYATLFFGEYDSSIRRLKYANCGHLPGLVLRGGGPVDRLESTCTVVGIFPNWDCAIDECPLVAGDTLVLYSDGVTEAFDEAGEEYGEQRLVAALDRYRGLPPQAMIDRVVDEVRQFSPFEQRDDITLIVARCK